MEKKYYVGLDVSLDKTTVCIVDDEGKPVKEHEVLSDADALCDFLSSLGLRYTSIGIEVSDLSVWLYRSLGKAGYSVVCLETRHVKSALSAQNVKTDKNAARGLAQIMRTGWYKNVHVKSGEARKHLMLLGSRRLLVDKHVDIENQIRGVLKMFGLKMRNGKRHVYSERLTILIADHPDLQDYVRPLQCIRDALLDEIAGMDRQIYALTRHDTVCQRFMTIPGVGPIIALLYKSTIDDSHRFRRSRHVGVHLGLTTPKIRIRPD